MFKPETHVYTRDAFTPLLATHQMTDPGAWWEGPQAMGAIIDLAARMSGMSLRDMRDGGRYKEVVLAKMHFCYLLARRGWSPKKISEVLRCDRTSVSYLLRRYKMLRGQS